MRTSSAKPDLIVITYYFDPFPDNLLSSSFSLPHVSPTDSARGYQIAQISDFSLLSSSAYQTVENAGSIDHPY
jgi:hypothetical protein